MAIRFRPLPLEVFSEAQRPYIVHLNTVLSEMSRLEGVIRNPLTTKRRSDATVARRADVQVDSTRITPSVESIIAGSSLTGTATALKPSSGSTVSIGTLNDGAALVQGGAFTTQTALPLSVGGTGKQTAVDAFNNLSPTTTKGDLIAMGAASDIRVAVGANGLVLTADSTQTAGMTWTGITSTFKDSTFTLYDNIDNTRTAQIQCGAISSGNNRVMTVPDSSGTLLLLAGQIGGTGATPTVIGIRETNGPTLLTLAGITDGWVMRRTGATVVGAQSGVTNTTAGFTNGTSTTITVDATFTGNTGSTAYTLGDCVRALKVIGGLPL